MMFKELSQVNVNEFTEQKGQFTYLSWSHAWAELMKHSPDATYTIGDVEYHLDNTATAHTTMTVGGITHGMFLPVLDFKNKPIPNPNAFDINTARMRCLVKNIAMFGLGIYIYAGEDLPMPNYEDIVAQHQESVDAIKNGIASDDLSSAAEAWFELSDDVKKAIWKAPTKGGCFTIKEREVIKSSEFREAHYGVAA